MTKRTPESRRPSDDCRTCDHPECSCSATRTVGQLISVLPGIGSSPVARAKELALVEFGFKRPKRAVACDTHFKQARRFTKQYVVELGLS